MTLHAYCELIEREDGHTHARLALPVRVADVPTACACGAPLVLRSLAPVRRVPPAETLPAEVA